MSKTSKPVEQTNHPTYSFELVPYDKLELAPNIRKEIDATSLQELVVSLKQEGILQPLNVHKPNPNTYKIVAGQRRYLAAKLAGITLIPCYTTDTEQDNVRIQFVENTQREAMHPLEESEALLKLIKEGQKPEQLANDLGRPVKYVYQRLKLNDLIPDLKKDFISKILPLSHAFIMSRLSSDEQKMIAKGDLFSGTGKNKAVNVTADNLLYNIKQKLYHYLDKAPFDKTDSTLYTKAGACTDCPKRSGYNKLLFPEIADERDCCTDESCFKIKTENSRKIAITHIATKQKVAPEKVVMLSSSYNTTSKKVLPEGDYKKVQKDSCPSTEPAIYVEGYDVKLNAPAFICRDPKCKVHANKSNAAIERATDPKKKAEVSKKKAQEHLLDCYKKNLMQAFVEKKIKNNDIPIVFLKLLLHDVATKVYHLRWKKVMQMLGFMTAEEVKAYKGSVYKVIEDVAKKVPDAETANRIKDFYAFTHIIEYNLNTSTKEKNPLMIAFGINQDKIMEATKKEIEAAKKEKPVVKKPVTAKKKSDVKSKK